uniref:Uncharacterized protein n=1 Tax=Trichuris muris TaxID=70415 RepID=A0A5S6QX62_TRIMR
MFAKLLYAKYILTNQVKGAPIWKVFKAHHIVGQIYGTRKAEKWRMNHVPIAAMLTACTFTTAVIETRPQVRGGEPPVRGPDTDRETIPSGQADHSIRPARPFHPARQTIPSGPRVVLYASKRPAAAKRFPTPAAGERHSGKAQQVPTAGCYKRPVKKQRWDIAEKRVLALWHLKYGKRQLPERTLCLLLAEKMAACLGIQRSAESIRGQLRRQEHKRLVQKFKRKLTGQ